ncbi:CNH domain-containing protein, partial [Mycena capillaripes]
EVLGSRRILQGLSNVFELRMLSTDTFLGPSSVAAATKPSLPEGVYTGKVMCSVPFGTADGRKLVAIGCADGLWIGFRNDSRSLQRVLHVKMVTQCAVLEDFGIFLVLANKSLLAYHIDAVAQSPVKSNTTPHPQKLYGKVQFFQVGSLLGRTLVICMQAKKRDSIFRVVEPVIDKIEKEVLVRVTSRLAFRQPKSNWFRPYKDFSLPCKSFDIMFLKARIVVLCSNGFQITDLVDFKSVTIPQREDPLLTNLVKRCESCRPLAMFRSSSEDFLLCYNGK